LSLHIVFFSFEQNIADQNLVMNINGLPDLCLLTIFENQSINQQMVNCAVCTRFRSLQHKLFLARKSVTLAIGPEDALEVIQNSCFNDDSTLLAEDGTRIFPKSKFSSGDIVRCDNSQFENSFDEFHFVHLFPNIVHLRIGISLGRASHLAKVCGLLQACESSQLE